MHALCCGGCQPFVEPLSERELEVLGLLAQGLTNRETAGSLSVTLGTVKTHLNLSWPEMPIRSELRAKRCRIARGDDAKGRWSLSTVSD